MTDMLRRAEVRAVIRGNTHLRAVNVQVILAVSGFPVSGPWVVSCGQTRSEGRLLPLWRLFGVQETTDRS